MEEAVLTMLEKEICFMGTIEKGVPNVRPMRPFVAENEEVWLVSHVGTSKVEEIEANNSVEICAVDVQNQILRVAGKLIREEQLAPLDILQVKKQMFAKLDQLSKFFSGPEDLSMIIYKFNIERTILRTAENETKEELNFRV